MLLLLLAFGVLVAVVLWLAWLEQDWPFQNKGDEE